MFTLNIQCSKDITKLNIDFADGTSTLIGETKNENKTHDGQSTTSDDESQNDGSQSDVRSSDVRITEPTPRRKNLKDYIDISESVETRSFEVGMTPPIIDELYREISVSEEIKNGKF